MVPRAAVVEITGHAGRVAAHPLPALGRLCAGVGLIKTQPEVGLIALACKPAGNFEFLQAADAGEIARLAQQRGGFCRADGRIETTGCAVGSVVVASAGAIGKAGLIHDQGVASCSALADGAAQRGGQAERIGAELQQIPLIAARAGGAASRGSEAVAPGIQGLALQRPSAPGETTAQAGGTGPSCAEPCFVEEGPADLLAGAVGRCGEIPRLTCHRQGGRFIACVAPGGDTSGEAEVVTAGEVVVIILAATDHLVGQQVDVE